MRQGAAAESFDGLAEDAPRAESSRAAARMTVLSPSARGNGETRRFRRLSSERQRHPASVPATVPRPPNRLVRRSRRPQYVQEMRWPSTGDPGLQPRGVQHGGRAAEQAAHGVRGDGDGVARGTPATSEAQRVHAGSDTASGRRMPRAGSNPPPARPPPQLPECDTGRRLERGRQCVMVGRAREPHAKPRRTSWW